MQEYNKRNEFNGLYGNYRIIEENHTLAEEHTMIEREINNITAIMARKPEFSRMQKMEEISKFVVLNAQEAIDEFNGLYGDYMRINNNHTPTETLNMIEESIKYMDDYVDDPIEGRVLANLDQMKHFIKTRFRRIAEDFNRLYGDYYTPITQDSDPTRALNTILHDTNTALTRLKGLPDFKQFAKLEEMSKFLLESV